MRVMVSRWGDELGIRIPRELAEDAQLFEGTPVDLRIESGHLVIDRRGSESLEMLLARVTSQNLHGERLADTPVGQEH